MPGYADYQRITNWDDALLLNDVGGAELEKTITRGRFNVSRFAYLMGKMQFTKVPVKVTLEWFMAETGGTAIGERTFTLDNKATISVDLHVPHMGPWLAIKYAPESAAVKYKPVVAVFNSNRVLPMETVPHLPHVLQATPFKLAAKATKVFTPEMFYAGPCEIFVQSAVGAGMNVGIGAMLKGYEYERCGLVISAASTLVAKIILPFSAQNYTIENSSASEGEYFFSIIPSVTGSS